MRDLKFVLLMTVVVVAGCGGGQGPAGVQGSGDVVIAVEWPQTTGEVQPQLVPAVSQSIQVTITANGQAVAAPALLVRPTSPPWSTATTIAATSCADAVITAIAYPTADGSGQGQAAATLHIIIPNGGTAYPLGGNPGDEIALDLVSTIDRVDVTPNPAAVSVGGSAQLTANARAANGNVVLVPTSGAFTWTLTSGASFASVDANGLVSAIATGQATVRVTESESGVQGTATVNVADAPVTGSGYTIVDTNQISCYNDTGATIGPQPGQAFYGQDAQFHGPAPSYRDNGDGTVSDLNTGLMWQQDPGDKVTWTQAVAGAASLDLAGYTDWRLPSIKELYSLIDFRGRTGRSSSTSTPYLDTNYFVFRYGDVTGERFIDSQYCTSTEYVSTTMNGDHTVFGVNFADGRIKGYGTTTPRGTKTFYCMYVRGNAGYATNDFADNGDGTVTDHATGLMWQQADDGVTRNWEEALASAEGLTLGGHDDWRLPNAKELQSIVDYTRSPDTTGSAAIDPVFDCTQIVAEDGSADFGFYWTGTSHLDGPRGGSGACYVAFGRAWGYMRGRWLDVHGAGCQRSDPKSGDPADYPRGFGPQGDARRIYNMVRCVRDAR